ncbi:MAG TPA: porin [Candidatus Acidoferrum sp.]|nr:porin [Candidatus Acidoferrum sp.]
MSRGLLVILTISLLPLSVRAQSPPPSDQTEQIKALLERVDRLEKRVAELEAKEAGTPTPALSASNPAPSPAPAPAAEVATAVAPAPVAAPHVSPPPSTSVHSHDQAPSAQEIAAQQAAVQQAEVHYPSLQIRGFGDVDFSATDQKGTNSGFNLGQFTLHFASALSSKVSYFAETTFNASSTGYTVELERSIIRYDYNDYFKISFGRYHTPIGYWNTAFHHGAWLQTSIARPQMVQFGGTIIPVHFVGFLAEGNIPSGGAGLAYNFGLGNGRGTIISRAGDAGDNNDNRAWVANIYSRPPSLYGLEMGLSAYRDKITLSDGRDYRELITGAHIVWTKETPEVLAEFVNINHRQVLTDVSTNSQAFYVQVGYRLPWLERTLKPYYRFEYTHMPLSEQVFTNQDLVGSTVGLRYDITNYAAFKGEFRDARREPGAPNFSGVFLQTDFTF